MAVVMLWTRTTRTLAATWRAMIACATKASPAKDSRCRTRRKRNCSTFAFVHPKDEAAMKHCKDPVSPQYTLYVGGRKHHMSRLQYFHCPQDLQSLRGAAPPPGTSALFHWSMASSASPLTRGLRSAALRTWMPSTALFQC